MSNKAIIIETMKNVNQINPASEECSIQIPDCSCLQACCADCIYMDTNDKNKFGDCYCGKKGKYYPPSDSTCGEFKWS